MSVYLYTTTEEYVAKDLDLGPDAPYYFLGTWLKVVGKDVIIPPNYSWDGCSPKIKIKNTVIGTPDFGSRTKYASLVHDALYQYAGLHPFTKKACDGAFYTLMKRNNFILAPLYYAAVRIFGSYFWNKCVKNNYSSAIG